jgi:endoglucanase
MLPRHLFRVGLALSVLGGLLTVGHLLTEPSDAVTANPLAVRPFYSDPDDPAGRAMAATPSSAAAIAVIARTPQARWFTESTPTQSVAEAVRDYVTAGSGAGATPVMVVYAIPGRDCGGFAAGGFAAGALYSAWIQQVVVGLADRPAAVIVEPDAVTSTDCLDPAARTKRQLLLRDAVRRLSADSLASIYLDGGHSRWLSAEQLAVRLRQAGVESARGFSLNVSNFFTTDEEVGYGEAVSGLLGGKHYVIDTSRNGAGPAPDGPLNWCNPPGRALGATPTVHTAGSHADAYLWIKNPGASDGPCDRGEPRSGVWFNDYAVGLVQRTER